MNKMPSQQQDKQANLNEPVALWHKDDPITMPLGTKETMYRPEILDAIEQTVESLNDELRSLSLDIHGEFELVCSVSCASRLSLTRLRAHPEIRFEEQ